MSRTAAITSEAYLCPITLEVMFEPVGLEIDNQKTNGDCKHKFERSAITQWLDSHKTCPCCKRPVKAIMPADPDYIASLTTAYALPTSTEKNNTSWSKVNFNLSEFANIVKKNEFNTDIGKRFILLLQHAKKHLNEKETAAGDYYQNKSAIEILASTYTGRQILRRHVRKETPGDGINHYYFGNAEISPESLQIKIGGITILNCLYERQNIENDLAQERADFLATEKQARAVLVAQEPAALLHAYTKNRDLFFKLNITVSRSPLEAVNEILQNVVYGQRSKVKEALEQLEQTNPALLQTVLRATATQPIFDYSGRKFENVTILEAAAMVGDVAINHRYEGAIEIISSYFGYDAESQKALEKQLNNVFPDGIEAHTIAQASEENIFSFTIIIDAIELASKSELNDIVTNPEKTRHLWSFKDDKNTRGNTLIKAFNQFREQFTNRALSEKIPSLQHLLCALTRYKEKFDAWSGDEGTKWMKRILFLHQIIGFIQRFLPAHEAQVFARGPSETIEGRVSVPENFNLSHADHFYPLSNSCRGIGFDYIEVGNDWRRRILSAQARPDQCLHMHLRNLCRAKTAKLKRLCRDAACRDLGVQKTVTSNLRGQTFTLL